MRLRAAFRSTPIDEPALKFAVCAYVDELKQQGLSVERVLTDIKRIAEVEASLLHVAPDGNTRTRTESQQIASRAVRWCIEYYYWTH